MVLLSKVVLNRTVGAMTEQLRIAGNRDDYDGNSVRLRRPGVEGRLPWNSRRAVVKK